MAKSKRRATRDDLAKLAENLVGEIIDGELFAAPRPASPHALASSLIGADLIGSFHRPPDSGGGPGGWWIIDEPELHLGEDVLVPDLAGWRRERMPKMPNVPAFELVPDWICEVVSPATERLDRTRKMGIYARAGVAHLWLINPLIQTLEAYRRDGEAWSQLGSHGGAERVRAAPFEAAELDLARWWIETPADEPQG